MFHQLGWLRMRLRIKDWIRLMKMLRLLEIMLGWLKIKMKLLIQLMQLMLGIMEFRIKLVIRFNKMLIEIM